MSLVLTTASVPDRDKVAYWNDAVSRTLVPMTVAPRGDGPFDGRIATHRLGYLQVSTMEADAERVSRTPALIARSPEALVAVGVQGSGTATFVQDGRRAEVGEGDMVVYDTTRPYSFDYPQRFSKHVFQLPRRNSSMVKRPCCRKHRRTTPNDFSPDTAPPISPTRQKNTAWSSGQNRRSAALAAP